jgi:hypothetical protein
MGSSRPEAPSPATGTSASSASLSDLPNELILLTASFLPAFPSPCEDVDVLTNAFLRDCRSVKALSQMCQRFKNVLKALVWKQLYLVHSEVEGEMHGLEQYLVDHPRVAALPRYVYVLWSKEIILKQLLYREVIVRRMDPLLYHYLCRILRKLPKVHSVQVLHIQYDHEPEYEADAAWCRSYPPTTDRFPNVQTLVIDARIPTPMIHFPDIERLTVVGFGTAWFQCIAGTESANNGRSSLKHIRAINLEAEGQRALVQRHAGKPFFVRYKQNK